ncbi:CRISPR-associated protein Cas4 [Ferviditalea candida]|uniref:CRISPR-associated exonuclease Cas4 n=1 Tax=Ferviditalea candida TaxID=3108399 RepID=A0ABU5ZPV3_9BACL|nr:CRISPR-associated protein Cas4 [Paenibacillaceae bacterium T2]
MISGIQHFAFCQRQWALIHIENQWRENVLTTEGNHVHQRVDDSGFDETRGVFRIVRSVPLVSESLRIRGIADMVEFERQSEKCEETVMLDGREGNWKVTPVEYKRGKPKSDDRDIVQLCAQAICLEEMLGVKIACGAIYYAETRRREQVMFSDSLRLRVKTLVAGMRLLYDENRTPRAEYQKHCERCSLISICKPKWSAKGYSKSAAAYVKRFVEGGEDQSDDC